MDKRVGGYMLEITFLGVGEAFDESLPNTSLLIRYGMGDSSVMLLLDCGFTAPPQFWKAVPEVDALDGVWISHFHGDHALGVPALLVRFWEEGRRKPLTFLGQKGIDSFIHKALDMAYPGFHEKVAFPIRFVEVETDQKGEISGLSFRAAENNHSQRDLAIRIDAHEKAIFYSGDGKPTSESLDLAKGCQLIVHEAFQLETEIPGHGTVKGSIDMARECGASTLALVHIQRRARKDVIEWLQHARHLPGSLNVIVPEAGYRMTL